MSIRTCANLRARKPKRPTSFWHDRLRSHDLSQLPYLKPILVKDSAICFAFFSARLTWCFVIRGFQYFHLVGNRNLVYSTSGGTIIQDQIWPNLWAILVWSKSANGGMNTALMLTKVSRKLYDPFAMIHCFQTWWHSLSRLLSFDASMSTRRAIVVCYYARVWVEIIVCYLPWHAFL